MDGLVEASVEGTPQGGPLSPLLANIYLDALGQGTGDGEGISFCRYADDCNIYVGSQAAAERTLTSIQDWIEKHLRLKVNAAKSGTGRVWERKFLGFRLDRGTRIGIAPESLRAIQSEGAGDVGGRARVEPVPNCETTGTATSKAGGDTSDWPRRESPFTTGGLDPPAHPEVFLVAMAQTRKDGCTPATAGSCGGRVLKVALQFRGAWRMAAHRKRTARR